MRVTAASISSRVAVSGGSSASNWRRSAVSTVSSKASRSVFSGIEISSGGNRGGPSARHPQILPRRAKVIGAARSDRLPESAQRDLLEGAIENSATMKSEFGGMLSAWTRGDVVGIANTFDRDLSTSPALRDSLIRQRNANWSKWIEHRMTEPGAVMIAVGAGHLAGPYSVLELLRKDGYKVRRLQ